MNDRTMPNSIIIIGAGSTGIGLAHQLKLRGLNPIILEEAAQVGASWRARHDQLTLNTLRSYSGLPGRPLPSSFDKFPTKSQFISFLEKCAEELGDSIRFGIKVNKIINNGSKWKLETSEGGLEAEHVVMATGTDKVPVIPNWPGIDSYSGEMLHAADFGDATRFTGKKVLLVGNGNSGVDVGNHLSRNGAGQSWVSIRKGSHVVPQFFLGLSAYQVLMMIRWLPISIQDALVKMTSRLFLGDLRKIGLPAAPKGPISRAIEDGVVVSLDNGFISAIKSGQFEVCGEIDYFSKSSIHMVDGTTLNPDVIIFATGYRSGLESLLGDLGLLEKSREPKHSVDKDFAEYPNLWFLGYTTSTYGNLYTRIEETFRLADAIKSKINNS
jgi:cation diffusion facilitator CzcD-associated flavoprotein CzcO